MAVTYMRPNFLMSNIINPIVMALGLVPVLSVKGRKTGKLVSLPILPFTHKGNTYLLSARGQTQWARNLRAAGEGTLTQRGRTRHFKAIEVEGKEREEVVTAYRKQIKVTESQFAALPNMADHPTFRLEMSDKDS